MLLQADSGPLQARLGRRQGEALGRGERLLGHAIDVATAEDQPIRLIQFTQHPWQAAGQIVHHSGGRRFMMQIIGKRHPLPVLALQIHQMMTRHLKEPGPGIPYGTETAALAHGLEKQILQGIGRQRRIPQPVDKPATQFMLMLLPGPQQARRHSTWFHGCHPRQSTRLRYWLTRTIILDHMGS